VCYGLSVPDRLRLILRALRECSEPDSFASVAKQYRTETKHALDRDAYETAMKKEKK
jgi:hypothetical protein